MRAAAVAQGVWKVLSGAFTRTCSGASASSSRRGALAVPAARAEFDWLERGGARVAEHVARENQVRCGRCTSCANPRPASNPDTSVLLVRAGGTGRACGHTMVVRELPWTDAQVQ
jgi:hypothetical protein